MDEQLQGQSTPHLHWTIFGVLWGGAYVAGSAAALYIPLWIFPLFGDRPAFGFEIAIASGVVVYTLNGLVSGSIQRWAFWLYYGRKLIWWRRASLLGWWLSGLAFWLVGIGMIFARVRFIPFPLAQAIVQLGIPTVIQWLVLRRHVRNAWIWIIASFAGSIVSVYGLLSVGLISIFGQPQLIVHLPYGLVMALTLMTLVSLTKQARQDKVQEV